jgi:hypothetical protein
MEKIRRLVDVYRFPGVRPKARLKGIFGDPKGRIIRLERRQKKRCVDVAEQRTAVTTTARDALSGICPVGMCGFTWRWRCGKVKRERLEWL